MTTLCASGLTGGYGGMEILFACDLSARAGEVTVIVGPNGAGKSTALRALFGMLRLRAGRVAFEGRCVTGLSTQARVRMGMALVPQSANVFAELTVAETLCMGGFLRRGTCDRAIAAALGHFPALENRLGERGGALSGGLRQQLAIARALVAEPRLLVLDEPTAGIAPLVRRRLFADIRGIAASGVAVLMVEQNAAEALASADRGILLVSGRCQREDSAAALLADPEIRSTFLGH